MRLEGYSSVAEHMLSTHETLTETAAEVQYLAPKTILTGEPLIV